MGKTPQKVTKDPKRQGAVRKCREKYVDKLREIILQDTNEQIKMINYIKDSQAAIFTGPTG